MKRAESPDHPPLSEGTKGLLSLLIIVHLCCVLAVLAANFRRSELLDRLTGIFAPFTQSLLIDPDRTAWHLTHGDFLDDDVIFTVDLYADAGPLAGQQPLATVTLPDRGSRWLEARRRYLALAREVQFNTPLEGEPGEEEGEAIIAIAKGVGRRLMNEHQAGRAVVQCLRRMSQPRDVTLLDPGFPPDDPRSPAYDVTIVTADVWLDDDGRALVARRVPKSEQAPLRTEGSR